MIFALLASSAAVHFPPQFRQGGPSPTPDSVQFFVGLAKCAFLDIAHIDMSMNVDFYRLLYHSPETSHRSLKMQKEL